MPSSTTGKTEPGAAGPASGAVGQLLIWGGVALGVAGVTAAGVIAARRLTDRANGDDPRPHMGKGGGRDDQPAPGHGPAAATDRDPGNSQDLAVELTDKANRLSDGLNGVVRTIIAAFESLRMVADQSARLLEDFAVVADQVNDILQGSSRPPHRDDEAGDDRERKA